MNIRKKMVVIVICGILFSAVVGTLLIYEFVQREVLASEITDLQKITTRFTSVATQRFLESQPKLKALATQLETELEKPIKKDEINTFYQVMQRNDDGVWRNQKPPFNGNLEAGIFLPPNSNESDVQKIQHLRIKQIMDIFGAAASRRMENIWYLSPHRSEIIFDKNYPNFAFEQKADNDYTKTPWVTFTTPQLNPHKEVRFTPPLFDPVIGVWMVSAIYPLYVHGEWMGSLGEDMPLTNVLEFMFQSEQLYSGTEHFLIDAQDNFVLAGSWQKELESSNASFKPSFSDNSELNTLFKKPLTHEAKLLSDNLKVHGHRYLAIAMLLEPLQWRYYLLVPVEKIMETTWKLFLDLLEMIVFVGVVNGFLIFTVTGRTVTRRIKSLTDTMLEYTQDHSIRAAAKLAGRDEIALAAKAFDSMANDIEERQKQLQESRDQFAALVTNIPGITYRCALDKDWTMLFMSGLVEELTGYPTSDFINNSVRTYASVIHPDDSQYVDDEINNAVTQNCSYLIEYRIISSVGEIRWVHERGRGIHDKKGNVIFLDGFILDITDRHNIEQNLKRSERKLAAHNADLLQFTHIAAHHLQEPTRRVVSFVQKLEDELATETKRNEDIALSLRFIEQSAKRQRALVRDIQLYLAAMQPRAEIEAINVASVIEGVLAKYAPKIREIQATIELGDLPIVMMDKPRLFDVFNVLIENALSYRRADVPLKIQISGKIEGNNVYYKVADNGIGIPIEYRERVFLVFERLQVNEDPDSTGVGLAMLKRIVESCNGSVSLRETLNGGVTVKFELPLL